MVKWRKGWQRRWGVWGEGGTKEKPDFQRGVSGLVGPKKNNLFSFPAAISWHIAEHDLRKQYFYFCRIFTSNDNKKFSNMVSYQIIETLHSLRVGRGQQNYILTIKNYSFRTRMWTSISGCDSCYWPDQESWKGALQLHVGLHQGFRLDVQRRHGQNAHRNRVVCW